MAPAALGLTLRECIVTASVISIYSLNEKEWNFALLNFQRHFWFPGFVEFSLYVVSVGVTLDLDDSYIRLSVMMSDMSAHKTFYLTSH